MTAMFTGLIIGLVAAQRITELVRDRRNTASLMAEGGIEHGAGHYPLFILLHASWLVCLAVWTLTQQFELNWFWLGPYVLLQFGRVWVIRTLGPYWTTRIISISGRPLVSAGPYRFVRHPNYWIVTTEIALLPLAFGAWQIAALYSVLNGSLLYHRIKVENAALEARR
jgi:methyltransferase